MNQEKPKRNIKVYSPGREFVLPYICREILDCDISLCPTASDADVCILNPGDNAPEECECVLYCPNIVGTGMTGVPMEIARRIARGSYYHLGGNEARLSTIHATDVAKAVNIVLDHKGKYVVTDGVDPTFHDFSEAIAWRINHKRILTLNSVWVNWIINPGLRRLITTDCVVDGTLFAEKFDFKPTPVTEYLRTHNYDDESL